MEMKYAIASLVPVRLRRKGLIFARWRSWLLLATLFFVVRPATLDAGDWGLEKRALSATRSSPQASDAPRPVPQKAKRTRVAEGEYSVFQRKSGGAVGPFENEVFNFRESWTIWRTGDGEYEVTGERQFESPEGVPHRNRFEAQLARDLSVVAVKEFAKLRWRRDSGPLTCEFQPAQLHCSSGGKDPAKSILVDIPMRHPFGILWPLSPFSLNSVARAAGRHVNDVSPVQLVELVEESAESPVSPLVLDGHLRYLGQEDIRVANQKWRADRFEMEVPLHPGYLIWTSPDGILLSLAVESGTKNEPARRMDLVRYEKFAEF
jgi:hypothetical protein